MTSSASGQDKPNLALVIGYPSGQDGAILLARDTGLVPQEKLFMFWCFIPYNKSFIDQACPVKMAGYWPRSFFACLWTVFRRSLSLKESNNCTKSRALVVQCSQTRDAFICAMLTERARADNLTICYFKKQIDVSFLFMRLSCYYYSTNCNTVQTWS